METKELIEKLIAHYEQAIEKVSSVNKWIAIALILELYQVQCGVCNCASGVFNVDIYNTKWVESYGFIWSEYPMHQETKDGVLRTLNVRLTNLKTELKRIS